MSAQTETRPGRSRAAAPLRQGELLARLAHATATCCPGRALVLARDARPFVDALSARRRHASTESLEGDLSDGVGFVCAVIAITDPADAGLLSAAIQRVWPRLPDRGRLVIATPNAEASEYVGPGGFREGDVRRLLEHLGRPKAVFDQPFAWLLTYVDKKRSGADASMSRSRLERFDAMATLCRGSVVELGCGAGALAATIHARGHAVVGVDLNGPKIERARSCYDGIDFIEADICQLDLLEGRLFDTVVLAEVLEHVPEAVGDSMLMTARRLLCPGGRIIISVPNRYCIPHRNHIRIFDRKALKAMLSAFGRPRTVATQPYKWLLMYADLQASGNPNGAL